MSKMRRESYHDYMLRRKREEDEERKKHNVQSKETVLYEADKHVQSVLVKWLDEKKHKMHTEDLKNLETSIKIIDIYGANYDSNNN